MQKYKILLKQIETGFTRVRKVNWNELQYKYYSQNLNKPIDGFVIVDITPITETEE